MAVVEFDAAPTEEVRAHRRTFITFERLVLFAALHIALTLACLALAFFGHAPGLRHGCIMSRRWEFSIDEGPWGAPL